MTTKDISEKQRAYESLVARRRKCTLCSSHSTVRLVNPSMVNGGSYDGDEIGPWTIWQGSLNAKVIVIGKDFGPVWYFKENEGRDSTTNPTNKTVIDDVHSGQLGKKCGGALSITTR